MKKLKKQRGFTLVEMLIVVAIIAILVAVSIPLFTNSLERARRATDAANERAAKAAAVSMLIEYSYNQGNKDLTLSYVYDAAKGEIIQDTTVSPGYGQCTSHTGAFIIVKFYPANQTYELQWSNSGALHGTNTNTNP